MQKKRIVNNGLYKTYYLMNEKVGCKSPFID